MAKLDIPYKHARITLHMRGRTFTYTASLDDTCIPHYTLLSTDNSYLGTYFVNTGHFLLGAFWVNRYRDRLPADIRHLVNYLTDGCKTPYTVTYEENNT